jgi:hypothetical protein
MIAGGMVMEGRRWGGGWLVSPITHQHPSIFFFHLSFCYSMPSVHGDGFVIEKQRDQKVNHTIHGERGPVDERRKICLLQKEKSNQPRSNHAPEIRHHFSAHFSDVEVVACCDATNRAY